MGTNEVENANIVSSKDFLAACRRGELSGAYLLFGDEEYLKRSCVEAARKSILLGDADAFNHTQINATEFKDYLDVLGDALGALPIFAEARICELISVDYNKLSDTALATLTSILEEFRNYKEHTGLTSVLIMDALDCEFDAGRLPKAPSRLAKTLSSAGVTLVNCRREGGANLENWALKHFEADGVEASRDTARRLVDHSGIDMSALLNELDKLAWFTLANGKEKVDPDDIKTVCCANSEEGMFDFSNALLEGNSARAFELLYAMKARKEKPEFILSSVIECYTHMYGCRLFSDFGMSLPEIASSLKIHEYRAGLYLRACRERGRERLERAMEACLDADRRIKSAPTDSYLDLDRLIILLAIT